VSLTSPLYTFPNSQQIIGRRLSSPHLVRVVITAKGNMALLTDRSDILIVPVAPAGYASAWIDTNARAFAFYYSSIPCIGGTSKDEPGLGPCSICPPRTRNPGTLPSGLTTCIPCSANSSTSFCSLAALVDIDLSTVPSYSQATAYPESADTTNIEDILLANVFHISSDPHCLVISPLFWALIVGALSFLIWVLMTVIKVYKWKHGEHYRAKAKKVFKRTDLIGEGKLWIGGLVTFPIVVLLLFSCWFSVSFLKRYPIEQMSGPATFACDQTLINSKFTTGLELLSLPKSIDAQPIFMFLDSQVFVLTVELINTGFTCATVTAQENRIGTSYSSLSTLCTQSTSDATTSVTFTLPQHYAAVQLNLTGPHWVGGVRLCLRADGFTDTTYTVRALDFCQLFWTPNQTLGRASRIPVILTKNINMTKTMETTEPTLYSGLWVPTFGGMTLSERTYYAQFGNYLRYISALTIIQIVVDERSSYIKNIQDPIVRTPEVVFHMFLFTALVIELFALTFLLVKLLIAPFFYRIQSACQECRIRDNNRGDIDRKLISLHQYDVSTSIRETQIDLETLPDVEYPRSIKLNARNRRHVHRQHSY
jgi:hypothetical protein